MNGPADTWVWMVTYHGESNAEILAAGIADKREASEQAQKKDNSRNGGK